MKPWLIDRHIHTLLKLLLDLDRRSEHMLFLTPESYAREHTKWSKMLVEAVALKKGGVSARMPTRTDSLTVRKER